MAARCRACPKASARWCRLLDAKAGRHMNVSCRDQAAVRCSSCRRGRCRRRPPPNSKRRSTGSRARCWTAQKAVSRVDPARLAQLLHPRLRSTDGAAPIATGLGVSPGAASGVIVFNPEDAARLRARGKHCILVVNETGPGRYRGHEGGDRHSDGARRHVEPCRRHRPHHRQALRRRRAHAVGRCRPKWSAASASANSAPATG